MVSEQRHRSTSCGRCRFIPRGCTSRRLVLQLSERQPCSIVMLQASPICAEAVNTHSLRTSTFKPQTCFFCKRKATIQSRKICSYVAKPDVGGAVRPQNFRQDNKKTKLNKDHKHSRQEGELTDYERSYHALKVVSQQIVGPQVCLRQKELCSLPQLAPSEVAWSPPLSGQL